MVDFTVTPAGGQVGSGLAGIGSILALRKEREEEAAAIEQARKEQADAQAALLDAYRSGDPSKMMEASIMHPSIAQQANQGMGLLQDFQKKEASDFAAEVLANPERAAEIAERRAQLLKMQNRDPTHTMDFLAEYQKNPEGALLELQMGLAAANPEAFKAYQESKKAAEPTKGVVVDGKIVDPTTGAVIYAGQEKAVTPESPIGKLTQDFRNGLVDRATYQAEIAKYGEDPTDAYLKDLELRRAELGLQREESEIAAKEQKEADAARQADAAKVSLLAQTEDVAGFTKKAMDLLDTTQEGYAGAAGAFLSPSGENAQLRRALETVKANIGFDQLMEMKRSSPSGGALGAVSVEELRALQSSLGSLDAMSSRDELKQVLKKVYDVYDRINKGAGGAGLADSVPLNMQGMSSEDLLKFLGAGNN